MTAAVAQEAWTRARVLQGRQGSATGDAGPAGARLQEAQGSATGCSGIGSCIAKLLPL